MAVTAPTLKARALRLLGQREHSRAELERKLRPHETEPGELSRLLDDLLSRGFINEQRVLESVVHQRANRLGAARVRLELQARGLDSAAVAGAVAGLRGSETERAREVWRKRFGAMPADASERSKQFRFLQARGFDSDAIRRVLGGADE